MFRSSVLFGIAVLMLAACSSSDDDSSGAGTGGAAASGGSGGYYGGAGYAAAGAGTGGLGGLGGEAGGVSGQGGSGGAAGTAGTGGVSGEGGSGGTAGTAGAGGLGGTGGAGGTGGTAGQSGTGGTGGTAGQSGTGGTGGTGGPTAADAATWIADYKAAHPGAAGDINAMTPAQIAADPAAQQLIDLCGPDQRPVIPELAWEYGGANHAWINPSASALVYCVYIPVNPDSEHWQYDPVADAVTVDVYVKFPEENPCASMTGADQVMSCLGDPTNIEILVDTASLNDGHDAGLELSEASTDVYLILPDGTRVFMYHGA
jgi:hypothetical protein